MMYNPSLFNVKVKSMSDKLIRLGEAPFFSFQGEGHYTGRPTVWIRLHGCNLECPGFGRANPARPDLYTEQDPLGDIDIKTITSVNDLPIPEYGCDSSYSWSKKFRHLAYQRTVSQLVDEILALAPGGFFGDNIHFCITGGEPMMNQNAVIDIFEELMARGELPKFVTIETNGTRPLKQDMIDLIGRVKREGTEWFWSISPKLLHVSGEQNAKAIRPEVVAQYFDVSETGQLKFVCNGTAECWHELEWAANQFERVYPIWVMPVGARLEHQESSSIAGISNEALRRRYNVAARVHVYVYGNSIGT